MSANEFDELIKAKFDKNDFAYNPANWEQLSQKLASVPPRKNNIIAAWPALTGIAATIALIMVLPMLWHQDADNKPIVLENTTTIKNDQPVKQENTTIPQPPANAIVYTPAKNTTPPVTVKQKTNKQAPLLVNAPAPEVKSNTEKEMQQTTDVAVNAKTKVPTQQLPRYDNKLYTDAEIEKPVQPKRTTINLVGGVAYNNALAGYSLGASANRKLGNKLYIEGNLAYVNNSFGAANADKSMAVGAFADQYDINEQPNPNAAKIKSLENTNTLSYVQFSPIVGCQVTERFNIGAGPDFQQLINTGTVLSEVYSTFDMGVIAKAEFGITEKLKAGVQYRNAVNKFLKNETGLFGEKTNERNYMQVQLKYSIFNK